MGNWIVSMRYQGSLYFYADKCRGCVQSRAEATRLTFEQANQVAKEACSSDCSASAIQV